MALAKVAHYYKSPSVLTTSFDTGPNGPIVKEITDYLPDAPLIRRPGQINAMDNEDFVNEIKKTGRKQIVIRSVQQLLHYAHRYPHVYTIKEVSRKS